VIDLSADLGEGSPGEEEIWPLVTSANVACGGHIGDAESMAHAARRARDLSTRLGAHPSYPDRENFGRKPLSMLPLDLRASLVAQIGALRDIAQRHGVTLRHVKPHGALYNLAVDDADLAGAIAAGVARFSRDVVLVGLAGSPSLEVYARAGFRVAAEAFADRRYEADGRLRARVHSDALLFDPAEAAEQALLIAAEGIVVARGGSRLALRADTLCLHGDTPGAVAIAAAVAARLEGAGVALAPLPLD
jgi:UPF0271 protein